MLSVVECTCILLIRVYWPMIIDKNDRWSLLLAIFALPGFITQQANKNRKPGCVGISTGVELKGEPN